MTVHCPYCTSGYLLPDHLLGPRGARVRCPKCQGTFVVLREEQSAAEAGAVTPVIETGTPSPTAGESRPVSPGPSGVGQPEAPEALVLSTPPAAPVPPTPIPAVLPTAASAAATETATPATPRTAPPAAAPAAAGPPSLPVGAERFLREDVPNTWMAPQPAGEPAVEGVVPGLRVDTPGGRGDPGVVPAPAAQDVAARLASSAGPEAVARTVLEELASRIGPQLDQARQRGRLFAEYGSEIFRAYEEYRTRVGGPPDSAPFRAVLRARWGVDLPGA